MIYFDVIQDVYPLTRLVDIKMISWIHLLSRQPFWRPLKVKWDIFWRFLLFQVQILINSKMKFTLHFSENVLIKRWHPYFRPFTSPLKRTKLPKKSFCIEFWNDSIFLWFSSDQFTFWVKKWRIATKNRVTNNESSNGKILLNMSHIIIPY